MSDACLIEKSLLLGVILLSGCGEQSLPVEIQVEKPALKLVFIEDARDNYWNVFRDACLRYVQDESIHTYVIYLWREKDRAPVEDALERVFRDYALSCLSNEIQQLQDAYLAKQTEGNGENETLTGEEVKNKASAWLLGDSPEARKRSIQSLLDHCRSGFQIELDEVASLKPGFASKLEGKALSRGAAKTKGFERTVEILGFQAHEVESSIRDLLKMPVGRYADRVGDRSSLLKWEQISIQSETN